MLKKTGLRLVSDLLNETETNEIFLTFEEFEWQQISGNRKKPRKTQGKKV